MDIATCRQAIEARLPHLHIRSLTPITQGWDSFVLEVNGELIFRFPRRPEVEASLEVEARLLPALAPTLSLAIPHFEYVCRRTAGCPTPFVGYRRIPGAPFDPTSVPATQARDGARRLGRLLGELQRFPRTQAAGLGVPDASPAQWRAEYEALYVRIREQVLPLLTARSRLHWEALWDEFLGRPEHLHFGPVLLHRDLTADHILYDPAQAALVGVIDWGDASTGDPAFDFAGLLRHGRAFIENLLAMYPGPVAGTFLERARFYARIVPFHEVLYGLLVNDRQHMRQGLAQLETG